MRLDPTKGQSKTPEKDREPPAPVMVPETVAGRDVNTQSIRRCRKTDRLQRMTTVKDSASNITITVFLGCFIAVKVAPSSCCWYGRR